MVAGLGNMLAEDLEFFGDAFQSLPAPRPAVPTPQVESNPEAARDGYLLDVELPRLGLRLEQERYAELGVSFLATPSPPPPPAPEPSAPGSGERAFWVFRGQDRRDIQKGALALSRILRRDKAAAAPAETTSISTRQFMLDDPAGKLRPHTDDAISTVAILLDKLLLRRK
jgi:hypothetical protein